MPSIDLFTCTGQARWPGASSSAASQAAISQALRADPNPSQLANIGGTFSLSCMLPDGRVLLAVDRFGIEPLCYRIDGDQLRHAARADQLGGSSPIDPQGLFDYLYFHAIPSPQTIYKDVFRLPPGHFALFDRGQIEVKPYWKPRFEAAGSIDFEALKQEFSSLLERSVADQLEGQDAACFLSGGTDSSTVAGMLCRVAGKPADTFSIGFDAEGYDEMAYARIAARHFGARHHEYYVTPADLVKSIGLVAAHYDQPFGNSSALPAYYCALMAKNLGVSKILAGDGGDELFGGNTRYAKQKVFNAYQSVPAALRSAVLEPALLGSPLGRVPGLSKAASYIRQAQVPMPDRLQTYNLLMRLGLSEVLEPGFIACTDAGAPARQQTEFWQQIEAPHLVDHMLAFDWRYTLAETDLPKVCGTAALAGLKVGFPFLDERLLAFSQRLPQDYKLRGLKLRWFFKEALRGFLPDEIIQKKKQGFGLPFGVWATRDAGLKALAEDSLRSLGTRGIVRPAFVESLLRERLQQHPGYYGEMVWILLMLEQWLRQHAPDFKL